MRLEFEWLPGDYAIVRCPPDAPVPGWAEGGSLLSISRSEQELSIVCRAGNVPPGQRVSAGWCALRLAGPFDFALTGVLASVLAPLAEAAVPIFAISTFDTDYVLIPAQKLADARAALARAGHVERLPPGSRSL
ncbi:MAG TPA: ACT domain-containing protein [Steroidobacteraceae bacterium]|nr:ACT domain-containing protein [Steroidobacteraceae bacterium]